MMPLVTVWPTPNGLPMASTTSPTSSLSLSANCRNGKSLPPFSIFSTARSVRSSWATMRASNSRLSDSATRICVSVPPLTTCVLVTMTPSALMITPEPSEDWMRSCGSPKPPRPPKKRWKNGSLANGETDVRTRERT